MDFITLKKRAAKELNLLDSSNAILTGKDVDETKLGQSVNDAYFETCSILRVQYPYLFEQESYAPNYSVTGTVDTSSTGTTLVATSGIFTNAMVGLYVENTTDSTSAKITAYTNTTTVTLDTVIGDTWDGDSIRIIDNTFTFGGDATDVYSIKWIKVRYSTTGSYVRATQRYENDAFQTNNEVFSQLAPIYTLTSVKVSTVPTQAIKVYPLWNTGDSKAVLMKYNENAVSMSADADTPIRVPAEHHPFLFWYAVAEGAVIRRDWNLYDRAMNRYEKGKIDMLANYRATSFDENQEPSVDRHYVNLFNRNI